MSQASRWSDRNGVPIDAGNPMIRKCTTAGLRSAIKNVIQELKISREHRKGLNKARQFQGQGHWKLNIGCGTKIRDGWLNIDISPRADIILDLRERLPFSDNSCSAVYSEHFLEHLEYPNPAKSFLKECFRVLEPGGLFGVGVPDTEWCIAEYSDLRQEGYFAIAKERWHPSWCETEMEHINYHFRQDGEHHFAYDFETLSKALTGAGFREIHRRGFDPALDSEDRKLGTIYVSATK